MDMDRVMAVIFERGFGILGSLEAVCGLVNEEKRIEIKTFSSVEAAYVFCCEISVKRWIDGGNTNQLPLPRLDDLLRAGGIYINPLAERLPFPIIHVDPNGEPIRYFSIVAPFLCSPICGIYNLYACILHQKLQYFHVREFYFLCEMEPHVLNEYRAQQMKMSAYLTETIRIPEELRVNEVFCDQGQGLIAEQFKDVKGLLE